MRLAFLSFMLFTSLLANCQEPVSIFSELKSVMVYRSGAELSHSTSVNLKQGNNEVMIEGLANALDLNSVQITCPNGVTIMRMEFSNNYLKPESPSVKVKMLTDSIQVLQKDMQKLTTAIQVNQDLLEVLKTNREIKGSQVNLNVAELVKLMDYYKAKSNEIQADIALLAERQARKQELINKMQQQVNEEEAKNTKTSGRLSLQLYSATQANAALTVAYVSPNAYWTPNYDIKVDNIKSPVKLSYKGAITQTTGIDWKKVKLSLSTSVPNQYVRAVGRFRFSSRRI